MNQENVMVSKLQIQNLTSSHCLTEIQAEEQQIIIGGQYTYLPYAPLANTLVMSGQPDAGVGLMQAIDRGDNIVINAVTGSGNDNIVAQGAILPAA
jgi:late competence protein required for DNA uptake (superfamily II DNA/RNA helicase)